MSGKRRKISGQVKFEAVMEALRGDKSVAQICRERDITESLLYKWKNEFIAKGPSLFEDKRSVASHDATTERLAELERMVGRLTMENEILKKGEIWLVQNRKRNGK